MTILERLLAESDENYKKFQGALIPTIATESIIGVHIPAVRRLAKELCGTDEAKMFLARLPHKYFDENNLHAFLIEQIKDFDECIYALDAFLPYVDNWATCDSMSPKVLKTDKARLLKKIRDWLVSNHTYTVRYGICMLMRHFLDGDFSPEYLKTVASIKSDEYYIKMMVAWYFATALAKQYDTAVKYIECRVLDEWTHRKAIQKAIESYRVTNERKEYLKSLK